MTTPLDAIDVIHSAFRRQMEQIDDAVYSAAAENSDPTPALRPVGFLSEVLAWHAEGEDDAILPAVERVAPLVAKPFAMDHEELEMMAEGVARIENAADALAASRATTALATHLRLHLWREDACLYPVLRDRTSPEEQGQMVGAMARKIPPDRLPEVVDWLFPLVNREHQEAMTRVWMQLMPPPVFDGVKQLIEKTMGSDWADLMKRVPELA